jgi:hypothetical protein
LQSSRCGGADVDFVLVADFVDFELVAAAADDDDDFGSC